MKVIGTTVTAAHLAGYFITMEARPAVNVSARTARPDQVAIICKRT